MKAYSFLYSQCERKLEQCVVGLLFASSIYWTWRLREKLTDATPRAVQETLRLWFAWALLGIAPSIVFFAFVYQSTVITPNRFVERLNRSLAHYNVAYSAEVSEDTLDDPLASARRARKPSACIFLCVSWI